MPPIRTPLQHRLRLVDQTKLHTAVSALLIMSSLLEWPCSLHTQQSLARDIAAPRDHAVLDVSISCHACMHAWMENTGHDLGVCLTCRLGSFNPRR